MNYKGQPYYYTRTKYPKIYNQTYWGHFGYDKEKGYDIIYENRNKFIEDYQIKNIYNDKRVRINNKIRNELLKVKNDHNESYITKNKNILLVNSPYGVSDEEREILINNGWTEIYKLYSHTASTFIKML